MIKQIFIIITQNNNKIIKKHCYANTVVVGYDITVEYNTYYKVL